MPDLSHAPYWPPRLRKKSAEDYVGGADYLEQLEAWFGLVPIVRIGGRLLYRRDDLDVAMLEQESKDVWPSRAETREKLREMKEEREKEAKK